MAIKTLVLVVFVVAGASYVNRANLTPFIPPNTGTFGQFGWSGVLRGAGVMFFAYIGFDAVSTAAQEAKQPVARHADRHPRFAGDLHGHLHGRWRSCCSASCRINS